MKKYNFNLIKLAFDRFFECNGTDLGAALAYYMVFSIVPIISILILILGVFLGKDHIRIQIFQVFQSSMGKDVANLLENTLIQAKQIGPNLWVSLLGGAALIFSVITITSEIQDSLDIIFGKVEKKNSFFKIIREKIASFSIIFLLAFLLITFLVISSSISFFQDYIKSIIPLSYFYIRIINFIVSFIFITGFVIINFRYLPHIRLSWKSIIYGGMLTSILFIIGKFAFGIYLRFSNLGSSFGTAGALLVLLFWVYYSAQILFFGACFSYVHNNQLNKS